MVKTCRQCRNFNPWAISMAVFDDTDICRKKVWECTPLMSEEKINEKIKAAETCTQFDPRQPK